ncbi:MAG: hypothetical protein P8L42_01145 [Flavicella sp.]|nr:hypothetical protein [Flavicella sp.]
MKNLIYLISICSTILISCNDEKGEVAIIEKGEYKKTELKFLFPEMEVMSQGNDSPAAINDDHIITGYRVHITGDIHPSDKNFSEIDLSEGLEVLTNGNIVITIEHPDFDPNALSTKSYYGVDEINLYLKEKRLEEVQMDFVQGRVVVLAEETLDDVIEQVNILGQSAIFDVTYYTASEMIAVEIITNEGSFKNEHANMLGEETHYVLNSLEEGLLIEDY